MSEQRLLPSIQSSPSPEKLKKKMPLPFLFLLYLPFLLSNSPLAAAAAASSSYPFDIAYHIDCGGPTNFTDGFNTTWLADRFYTGGAASVVSEPLKFVAPHEKTLRFFPVSSGKKNCYIVPNLPLGRNRFFFRTFTLYDNYDGKHHSPSFDVSVEGTLVFSWRSPWPQVVETQGAYSDLFAFVDDGEADICFYSIATDNPIIASLEITQVDPASYDSRSLGDNHLLINYGRFAAASAQWGPGFSTDPDPFGRSWQAASKYESSKPSPREISTNRSIRGADQHPNYFPVKLYQTALVATATDGLRCQFTVDAKLDYLLWLHFAEIDDSVTKAGQRVFVVQINGKNETTVDIFKEVGSFAAFTWSHTVRNLSTTTLTVKLVPVVGAPLICGLENYAMVAADLSTTPEQVSAMKAMKDSLRIPDRMGWNGDPCAPTNWDAWEGVTCHPNKNGTALVISQIDLGSQGLKGYISDQISLLTNLVSLNLSSNSLGGTLPSGLGHKALVRLDLSHNEFSGLIPESLSTSGLQLVLLNDNALEGQVPEELYSVGVHGGAIDLSDNKALCGVPSLPECPAFWRNGSLTTGGKVAIGLACLIFLVVVLLVIYICCIRRGNNDYDFELPQDLMSLAAKRNRYQRQKSLMLLEMESQHAKGLPMTLNSL